MHLWSVASREKDHVLRHWCTMVISHPSLLDGHKQERDWPSRQKVSPVNNIQRLLAIRNLFTSKKHVRNKSSLSVWYLYMHKVLVCMRNKTQKDLEKLSRLERYWGLYFMGNSKSLIILLFISHKKKKKKREAKLEISPQKGQNYLVFPENPQTIRLFKKATDIKNN